MDSIPVDKEKKKEEIKNCVPCEMDASQGIGYQERRVACRQESRVTARLSEGNDDTWCRRGSTTIRTGGVTTRKNTATMLGIRETGVRGSCSCDRWPWKSLASAPFRKKQEMDMFGYNEEMEQQGLKKERSTIIEIIAIEDIVILRSNGGLAAAFCRVTNKLLAFLNASSSESIEALFYNKYKESLLIVSTDKPNGHQSPMCRELTIRCILRKKLDHWLQIFKNEDLSWPGYLDVDSTNGLVMIRNKRTCRLFDLKCYLFKYELCGKNLKTVLLHRPQVLVVQYTPSRGKHSLEIISAETGEMMTSMKFNIARDGLIKCFDMINGKLLIKQEGRNLQVVDPMALKHIEVQIGEVLFLPLLGRNLFVTFQQESTEVRDTSGKIIRSIDDLVLYNINSILNDVWVSRGEDIIISVCRTEGQTVELVKICSVDSGRLLTTIDPNTKVTAMCYNDDLHELYIGSAVRINHAMSCSWA